MNVVANTLEPSITIDQLKQSRRSHKDEKEKDGVTLATQKFADTYKKMDAWAAKVSQKGIHINSIGKAQEFSNVTTKKRACEAQGPHSHILMTGRAKSDFFGSMKDAGIFWGREKKRDFFGLQKKD